MKQEGMTPEVAKKFKYWQTRTIIASMIGYALFYFVRKNLSIATVSYTHLTLPTNSRV